ncbi:primosomal protein N' [Prosthecomicrobium hirschii]|uniref:primosomal protein N' n=1 Tax=Prosthecodimorpha hirschii TaxID=665126 RepID=UPI001129C157|nr:primosomal protein N' [Prosthecomicrobium hirschii]TPQ50736.1 primosomal protein N' [Prosthecomicrobium hirschii]
MAQTDLLFDSPAASPRDVVPVVVPVALDQAYSYRVPRGVTVRPGTIVEVPLGTRAVTGVVWDDEPGGEAVGHNRLKPIAAVHDAPPLGETIRRFVDWVARYYMMPRGMVLRMVLRSPEALEPEAPIRGVRLVGAPPERLTPARRRVLEALVDGLAWSRLGLAAQAGVSVSVVDGLIDCGTLETVELRAGRPADIPEPDYGRLALTDDQQAAAEDLTATVAEGGFKVVLIDGVTGSGKTEVYFEAIAAAVKAGRQALVLLPEIALTAEFTDRFAARFGAKPEEWHSDVSAKGRARTWRGVATGEVRCVIGARSALFLPFRDLGLVVVDEEHDGAYKQDEGVVYHARDMAVVRGRLGGFPVVLASATPSIESRVNADQGRYRRLVLPARVGGARLPEISAIDLRQKTLPRGRAIAPRLQTAIDEAIGRGEQALLFLNRRGYAPLTLCRSCGHRFECPNCSTWLVEHRFRGVLACHHCGHTERRPDACPSCGDVDSLTACGPGVERVAEEAATLFPEARRLVLSSDMPGGTKRLKDELGAIAKGEFDLVIGTQLVAKGHNFPKMTVVGVVDADLGLAHGDPRAAEKTFQLLQQVTGRAGRAGGDARGFLQTHAPDHPVMKAIIAGDRERFYAAEIDERRRAFMPPFSRLAAVIVSADERDPALAAARDLAGAIPPADAIRVLGPAEAPIAVMRGRHRLRFLVIASRQADLQGYLASWLLGRRWGKGGVKIQIDIDPQSFL